MSGWRRLPTRRQRDRSRRIADRDVLNQLWWPHDNRHVVFFREQGGDENWQPIASTSRPATSAP